MGKKAKNYGLHLDLLFSEPNWQDRTIGSPKIGTVCILKEDCGINWLHLFRFFFCALSNVFWNCLLVRMQNHIGCICCTTVCFQMFPQIACAIWGIVTLVAFVWLFSTVRYKMCPQIACLKWGIITLIAFIWFFSTVCFPMCPRITCTRWGIITLVAFVWLFPSVHFQMYPQIACLEGCIITLVAFFGLFSTVCFQMCPQNVCPRSSN